MALDSILRAEHEEKRGEILLLIIKHIKNHPSVSVGGVVDKKVIEDVVASLTKNEDGKLFVGPLPSLLCCCVIPLTFVQPPTPTLTLTLQTLNPRA